MALTWLERAIEWDRKNLEAWQLKGNLLLGGGEVAAGQRCYEEILRQDSTLTAARYQLAISLLRMGKPYEARKRLEEILLLEPHRAAARQLLRRIDASLLQNQITP
jgi:tetratricopeptide (TPR) repeat protein